MSALVLACGVIRITGRHFTGGARPFGMGAERSVEEIQRGAGTIRRTEGFDGGVGARTDTLSKVIAVLEKAAVEFLNDERPGVRMRAPRPGSPSGEGKRRRFPLP
jgi:hypothetical protein